eukprot:CAMPEP_0178406904 /NCGR_PEP_ID=MMETSP0689_2-20121128/19150_1 /TAXON_ID=160604 /ORGANISM="Amphidinium massartii, Strain CS-259" /LENGTH=98 /DNA_ID=CAMNT_0020027955 /DNA_START=323 /DNA_END=621 /DNA_ORIENTATION=-
MPCGGGGTAQATAPPVCETPEEPYASHQQLAPEAVCKLQVPCTVALQPRQLECNLQPWQLSTLELHHAVASVGGLDGAGAKGIPTILHRLRPTNGAIR